MTIDYYENNNAAIINLNRPKYLNTLSYDMIQKIDEILNSVSSNDRIKMVIFKGEGDKAFCAGGDVKSFYEEKFTDTNFLRKKFFYDEYKLNYRINTFNKTIISLVDGICMGGGVGLAMHGDIVVVSENVTFAMPETAIGLFPDVGAGHILSNLDGDIGLYLALTGKRVKSADLKVLGLAHNCIKRINFDEIESKISLLNDKEEISNLLDTFNLDIEPVLFPKITQKIDECFKFNKVEQIMDALKRNNDDWSKETLSLISKMSPTSLKITLKQIRLAKDMSLSEDLIMEYRMTQGCMRGHDFYEGVRSVLVDKDHSPIWKPNNIDLVTEDMVDEHFKPLGKEDLIL